MTRLSIQYSIDKDDFENHLSNLMKLSESDLKLLGQSFTKIKKHLANKNYAHATIEFDFLRRDLFNISSSLNEYFSLLNEFTQSIMSEDLKDLNDELEKESNSLKEEE